MDKQQFECFTLSPLDGRYAGIKDALGEYFSEYALVKYRVFVEIQWLKFLIENVESDVLSKFNKDFFRTSFHFKSILQILFRTFRLRQILLSFFLLVHL